MTTDKTVKLSEAARFHENVVAEVPRLNRGLAWCHRCGHQKRVNSAQCLRNGWPMCCGETMSIDSPEERAGRAILNGEKTND